ncbi:hypothetical protein [Myxococcus sp. CA051A]|nr:hypothetical protein [Myxococcus sp. CA051A]
MRSTRTRANVLGFREREECMRASNGTRARQKGHTVLAELLG